VKTSRITRRCFLQRSTTATAALATGALIKPTSLFAGVARAGFPVRFPADWSGGTLTAAPANIEVWPGEQLPLLAVNGQVPAPTIRVRKGGRFSAEVRNQLSEPFVLHWHGILAPERMDGHPRDAVAPGQSYTVDFHVRQQAGTYWYHAHAELLTGKQAHLGLAGFFIVEDPSEERFSLPSGNHDLPLLVQDKRTNGAHSYAFNPEEMDAMMGFLGDAVFVNNTPEPWLSVDRGLYRLRLLNGSNARIFRLGFEDERPFSVIANDAGLLAAPVQATTIMLAPGQRCEILVDFSAQQVGDAVVLMSHPFEGGGHGGMGAMAVAAEAEIPPQGAELPVLTFYVDADTSNGLAVPQHLAHLRHLTMHHHNECLRMFRLQVDGAVHPINGALFDVNRIDLRVPVGRVEMWEYINESDEFHPMHPHGTHFQVMERHMAGHEMEGGMGEGEMMVLPAEDQGWKDTVLVAPGETVRVLVRFTHPGTFVHHCHNLEHEDNGMMQNVEVLPYHHRHQADDCSDSPHSGGH